MGGFRKIWMNYMKKVSFYNAFESINSVGSLAGGILFSTCLSVGRPFVCPSVRPSVTDDILKTNEPTVTQIGTSDPWYTTRA